MWFECELSLQVRASEHLVSYSGTILESCGTAGGGSVREEVGH